MAAVANLQHGQVILATQAGVFLNTAALAKSRFAHVFSAVKGLDERAQVCVCVSVCVSVCVCVFVCMCVYRNRSAQGV